MLLVPGNDKIDLLIWQITLILKWKLIEKAYAETCGQKQEGINNDTTSA